ncbi:DUF6923 family protein [Microbacterium sp. SSM24]|uniref:DUF6923 family protein n=1 Tax=Microbacterium sp. SSM24 TaxID=2991714 RepID=UPI002226556C|nr:SpaA isopeptide-forming pilin-related protein [Microbacterium sp. SSM24]MCW3493514.1 SpaA isopeptide-forming pilin-related protein [Microbacterium sp. SSM24]
MLAASLVAAVVLVPVAAAPANAAPGDPFDANTPAVFVAQDTPTQLYRAVHGTGAITFAAEGAAASVSYNAMSYNTTNNYLYAIRRDAGSRTTLLRIGQGGVVTSLGAVAGLANPGAEAYNQGAFGSGATANILYVRASGATTSTMYAVNITTRTATLVTLSAPVPNVSDLVWKDGFLWGLQSDDVMYRINPSTGQVSSWPTGLGLSRTFGAQWVYGNGNLGLSSNVDGNIYQVAIGNPAGAAPTFTLIAQTTGPTSANNDGAANPGLNADLGIVKTGPATYTPGGSITYSLAVTNHGPGVSSGSQLTDALPAGFTLTSTSISGCAVTAGVLRCALPGMNVGATQTLTITGTLSTSLTGALSNTARVIGNELDPNPANDQSSTSATQPPFRCAATTIYGLNTSGAILAIDRTTGASVQEGFFPAGGATSLNGLAITSDGRFAYATTQAGTKTVYRYDTTTGIVSTLGTIPGVSVNLFMGALNPTNGLYYVGGRNGSEYVFYAFDPATGSSSGLQFRVAAPAGATGGNGDLVFDSQGRAYIVTSTPTPGTNVNELVVVDAPPSDGSLSAARLLAHPAPTSVPFQGIAFGSDGYLYTQHSGATKVLSRVDPNSGAQISSVTIRNPDGSDNTAVSDLSSCTLNSTLTLRKNIVGRYAASDQFTVTITGNGIASGNTGTTSGSSTGLQTAASATAGALVGVPGRTYTITETPAGGASLANYRSTWECRDTSSSNALLASGTGASGTVTMPLGSNTGSHVVCVFTNTPIPSWTLSKQALRGTDVLPAGAAVQPGEVITYRVTATNTSLAAVDAVRLTDDLTQVLDDATFVPGSAQLVIAGGSPSAVPNPVGGQLVAGPFTLPGSATAELTYRVRVDDDAWSARLTNVVTGAGGTPGDPLPPQSCTTACTTTQITPSPVQIQKVGEASSGDVVPMDGSRWAIWDAAVGGTALVDPVPAATTGGNPVTGLFRATTLTAGTYWLEETRALDGFALLPERVPFTIAADGSITLGAGVSASIEIVTVGGVATIRVEDMPAFDLPAAGGPGATAISLVGLALLLCSFAVAGFIRVRQRRSPALLRGSGE